MRNLAIHRIKTPALVSIGYLILGALWIYGSDKVLSRLFHDSHALSRVQTFKGWFFVFTTGLLLFAALVRVFCRLHETQRKLEQEEAQLRLLFDNMITGFAVHEVVCNEAGEPVDYRFVEVNPAFEKLVGKKAAEVRGCTAREVFPEIEPYWIETYGAVALTGKPTTCESYFKELDRTFQVWAYSPRRGQFATVFMDITEQRKAECEIREAKEQLQYIIDNTHDTIFQIDLDGNFIYGNAACETMTGFPLSELPRMNMMQLIAPEHRKMMLERFKARKNGQSIPESFTVEIVHKNGSRLWLEMNTKGVYDDAGRVVGIQGVARDVTERKHMEEAFRQSQKMEAVGRLASGVAHDFNNILQSILGFANVLLMETENEQARQDLHEIQHAAKLAGDLTHQLLAFSRNQPAQLRRINMNELIAEETAMLKRMLGENHRLDIDVDPSVKPARIDSSQIEQVVMNLVLNARDAMPGGGRIRISTRHVVSGLEDGVPMPRTGEFVCVSVGDEGVGMDKDVAAHIFEPFFTTKPIGKGTGLGLAVSYGIVDQHRGWISVESNPGEGSTFRIYLPVEENGEPDAKPAEGTLENVNLAAR